MPNDPTFKTKQFIQRQLRTAPKRDPRDATPGAKGLSDADFRKMMEELGKSTKKAEKAKPLSMKSALKAQEGAGITSPEAALRKTAAARAIEKNDE